MACFHGGAFWSAIGDCFDDLSRRNSVVNADVLDAWFPPAPQVLKALAEDIDWQVRTSPPAHAEGLVAALAEQTGIAPVRILVGGGSSSLIFLAFRTWLKPGMKVLVLDPSYGEYSHVAEVAGVQVDRFALSPSRFELDLDRWISTVRREAYVLVVLVNPNNPTGQAIPALALEAAIRALPVGTRVWIDEAYAPYARDSALDLRNLDLPNLFVVRSMSKAFALSGLRVAYLVGPASEVAVLRAWSPPWSVSLPAQIAAIAALASQSYYETRYRETAARRDALAQAFQGAGLGVQSGVGNWVLVRLSEEMPCAHEVTQHWAKQGVFVRDAGKTSPVLGERYLRIAVRPEEENLRVLNQLPIIRSMT